MSNKHMPSYTRNGMTAVEFAMIAPVLFLVIFAGLEFVRVNMIRHTVENASYAASREVIVPGASKAEAIDKANNILAMVGIKNASITFTPDTVNEETDFVTTNITVPMSDNSWGFTGFLRNANIVSETEMRTERAPTVQSNALPTVLNPPPPPPPTPPPTKPPVPKVPTTPTPPPPTPPGPPPVLL